MGIWDEINRINQNIANAYTAMGDMGATIPKERNSANMARTIMSIPQSSSGDSGDSVNKILVVDAVAEFTSFTEGILTGLTHTFEEIQNAYDDEYFIYFRIDIGSVEPGTVFAMPLCAIKHDAHMSCTTILDISDSLTYIQFFVTPSGGAFILKAI